MNLGTCLASRKHKKLHKASDLGSQNLLKVKQCSVEGEKGLCSKINLMTSTYSAFLSSQIRAPRYMLSEF